MISIEMLIQHNVHVRKKDASVSPPLLFSSPLNFPLSSSFRSLMELKETLEWPFVKNNKQQIK